MIKKNITINFCGSLYNIDEDAYELLMHYTESIRRYFSKREGTEDVADDIEARIAELFDELIANGAHAIDIEMTEKVIHRIGDLEEIAPEVGKDQEKGQGETATETIKSTIKNSWETVKGSKRYYRDMGNKVICGVLAGCARFFGGSPLAWRICFFLALGLIAAFCNVMHMSFAPVVFITVIGYFVMAIIAPKAVAPEEVLQMKGKEITPQNIAEEVSIQQAKRGSIFADIMSGIGKIALCVLSLWIVFCLVAALGALGVFISQPMETIFQYTRNCVEDQELYYAIRTPLFFCIGAGIAILCILTYCCFHAISSSFGKRASMSFRQRLMWLIAFICSVAVLVGSIVMCAAKGDTLRRTNGLVYIDDCSHEYENLDGKVGLMHYSHTDWDYCQRLNIRVMRAKNITDTRFTYNGDYYTGDSYARYMDAYSANHNLIYQAQSKRRIGEAGKYKVGIVCRASEGAVGAYAFAKVYDTNGNELSKKLEAIPAEGDTGNNLWKKDSKYALPASWENKPDTLLNYGLGKGWSYVEIDDIDIPWGAFVVYGVSTDPEFTGQTSSVEWVSACDFKLSRTDK